MRGNNSQNQRLTQRMGLEKRERKEGGIISSRAAHSVITALTEQRLLSALHFKGSLSASQRSSRWCESGSKYPAGGAHVHFDPVSAH